MNLPLTNDEANLVRYACNELANKRGEEAMKARIDSQFGLESSDEWASANEKQAKAYHAIADRIRQLTGDPTPPVLAQK